MNALDIDLGDPLLDEVTPSNFHVKKNRRKVASARKRSHVRSSKKWRMGSKTKDALFAMWFIIFCIAMSALVIVTTIQSVYLSFFKAV